MPALSGASRSNALLVLCTSLNYWRRPVFGWRRNIDMVAATGSLGYQVLLIAPYSGCPAAAATYVLTVAAPYLRVRRRAKPHRACANPIAIVEWRGAVCSRERLLCGSGPQIRRPPSPQVGAGCYARSRHLGSVYGDKDRSSWSAANGSPRPPPPDPTVGFGRPRERFLLARQPAWPVPGGTCFLARRLDAAADGEAVAN